MREHFSDAEAVELTLDVMRNASNKIAVALGGDAPASSTVPSSICSMSTVRQCSAEVASGSNVIGNLRGANLDVVQGLRERVIGAAALWLIQGR